MPLFSYLLTARRLAISITLALPTRRRSRCSRSCGGVERTTRPRSRGKNRRSGSAGARYGGMVEGGTPIVVRNEDVIRRAGSYEQDFKAVRDASGPS